MIPRFVRTPEDMKAARNALQLTAESLALMVRVEDARTVRRWELGERPIPGPITVIMETAMNFLSQKIDLERQLDQLNSGELATGSFGFGSARTDTTDVSIAAVENAIKSYDDALVILTRQPSGNGSSASRSVHWYTLRRMTPKFNPPEEDYWTLPGETSPEAALLYFAKDTGFGALELCHLDDQMAEFVLEQRIADRRYFGNSQRVRPGDLVRDFCVRRKSDGSSLTKGAKRADP